MAKPARAESLFPKRRVRSRPMATTVRNLMGFVRSEIPEVEAMLDVEMRAMMTIALELDDPYVNSPVSLRREFRLLSGEVRGVIDKKLTESGLSDKRVDLAVMLTPK